MEMERTEYAQAQDPAADPAHACALTGHRQLGADFSAGKLREIFDFLTVKKGVNIFYCGMALGFDTAACELLCGMRDGGADIRVIACVPCPEQPARFNERQKQKYGELLARCDERVVLAPRYSVGCMHARNRYMVDRAAYLVAYCNREKGGTASTVRYAQRKGREILFVR